MRFLRILVAEDYEPFRRFICLTLRQRAEFQVIEASDGLEAVEKAEQLRPDLILLDLSLPKLNGFEAAKRIRRLAPHTKLLIVSQESSSDVVQEALRLGARGYVHKLHAQHDLLPAIEAVLAGGRFVRGGLEFSKGPDAEAPYRHEILFCSEDTILLDCLARLIAVALNAGNAAIALVTESHRVGLPQRLREQGVDIDAVAQRGTYVALDVAGPPNHVRVRETVRGLSEAASRAGKEHPRVAVCCERAGRLWAEGKAAEAIQLEQHCHDLAKTREADILCLYPLLHGKEDGLAFLRLCAEHTGVYSP